MVVIPQFSLLGCCCRSLITMETLAEIAMENVGAATAIVNSGTLQFDPRL